MPKIVEVQGLGNVEFPDAMDDSAIGAAISKQLAPQPSLLRRAVTWATTPSEGMGRLIEENKTIADKAGPAPINRLLGVSEQNEPGWLTGAKSFVSGIPGHDPYSSSHAADERMARFGQQHPVLNVALPMAGGLMGPNMLPASTAAAESGPGALQSMANRLAARTVKGTATEYKNLGNEGVQDLGRMLLERKAVRFGSSPATVAERVAQLPEATGQELGGAIEALDQTGSQVSKKALADRFLRLADEARAGGPGAAPVALKYEKAAADVLKDIQTTGEPMMSFKQAEQWKRAYQAPINYSLATNTPLEMGSKEIASAARQGVEDAASVAGEGSQLGERFLVAKKESGLAQQAAKMAEGAEGRRTARNMLSPSSIATNLAGVATAVATGHPAAAIPALALGPAQQFIRSRGPSALAVLLNAAGKGTAKLGEIAAENPAIIGNTGQAASALPRLMEILAQLRANRSPAMLAQNE